MMLRLYACCSSLYGASDGSRVGYVVETGTLYQRHGFSAHASAHGSSYYNPSIDNHFFPRWAAVNGSTSVYEMGMYETIGGVACVKHDTGSAAWTRPLLCDFQLIHT
jgi:hypothetical protein